MEKDLTFKLVIIDNDERVIAETILPFEAVANTVMYLPDSKSLNEFYKFAALHPASRVREHIANKHKLSEEVFNLLAKDKSIDVLRELTYSESFRKYADASLVKRLIDFDYVCAEHIADYFEQLEQVDSDVVINLLMTSKDPSARLSLIYNFSTPKRIVKMFLNDDDCQVSEAAKRRLEN